VNKVCPTRTVNNTVSLDVTTPYNFDNVYFQNLVAKKGLLPSDEILFLDHHTNMEVLRNAKKNGRWKKKFVEAIIKMGTTDLKLGTQGEIRNNCRKINS
jgi:peroxidase